MEELLMLSVVFAFRSLCVLIFIHNRIFMVFFSPVTFRLHYSGLLSFLRWCKAWSFLCLKLKWWTIRDAGHRWGEWEELLLLLWLWIVRCIRFEAEFRGEPIYAYTLSLTASDTVITFSIRVALAVWDTNLELKPVRNNSTRHRKQLSKRSFSRPNYIYF